MQSARRLSREIFRALARLPLPIKVCIGLAIVVEFLIVTQWERLTFREPPPPATITASVASEPPINPLPPPAEPVALEESHAKRMVRFEIIDPQVQVNGSILGNGQVLYLYGIKAFDSKNLCTRRSGERWACGLHAYATLRNTIAKKTIVCDPKTLLPSAIIATCRLGTTNIALAAVRGGVVQLEDNIDDAELVSAQAFARNGKLGLWDR